jgi:ribosomal-protein-alanine N-acetyltransferase
MAFARLKIRLMKEGDLDQVMVLDPLCFHTPWSKATYLSELARGKGAYYLVGERGDKIVAYGGSWIIGKEMHITTIGVDPDCRRQGIAERMMIAFVEEAWRRNLEEITLEYAVSNAAAEALYEKFGFTREGLRKGYYQDTGEDAVVATVRRLRSPLIRQRVELIRAALEEAGTQRDR